MSLALVTKCVVVLAVLSFFKCVIAQKSSCPIVKPGTFGTCDEKCSADEDCPGKKLCVKLRFFFPKAMFLYSSFFLMNIKTLKCSNGCGHHCVDPVTSKPGYCQQLNIGPIGPVCTSAFVSDCSSDSDCFGYQKCVNIMILISLTKRVWYNINEFAF
jgi:hypothetical protein